MNDLSSDSLIKIQPIQLDQIESAKKLVVTVCLEIWQGLLTEAELKQYDSMIDIDNLRSHYFDNAGMFLVLLDGAQVVGMGGIRKLDDEICELKRMWFLPAYRGLGWGWKMTQILFDFAWQTGYQKVRLDLFDAELQTQAVKFYRRLGFYSIERYNNGPCSLFMENTLESMQSGGSFK